MPQLHLSVAANTYNGWFIGSGFEYGFDILPGLFFKTEYRYSSYNTANLPVLNGGAATGNLNKLNEIHADDFDRTGLPLQLVQPLLIAAGF